MALLPAQVAEPGKKVYFPAMFLLVSKRYGNVLDHELLSPEEGIDKMYARFPDLLIKAILKQKARPHVIEIRHPLFYLMLKKVMYPTKIKIVLESTLNKVEDFLKSFEEKPLIQNWWHQPPGTQSGCP